MEKSRMFGAVTLEFYQTRDAKTGIGIGKPLHKTVYPEEAFLLDDKGNVVVGEDGFAVRVK